MSFDKISFPIVRRVFGGLVANELVSVQPMSLPEGLLFSLDYTYGDPLSLESICKDIVYENLKKIRDICKEIVDEEESIWDSVWGSDMDGDYGWDCGEGLVIAEYESDFGIEEELEEMYLTLEQE